MEILTNLMIKFYQRCRWCKMFIFSKLVFVVQLLYFICNFLFIENTIKTKSQKLICVCEEKYFFKEQIRLYRDLNYSLVFLLKASGVYQVTISLNITYFLQSILLFHYMIKLLIMMQTGLLCRYYCSRYI